jgi:uncharacterized SAM-binding protein YcdF (DUF218 family)
MSTKISIVLTFVLVIIGILFLYSCSRKSNKIEKTKIKEAALKKEIYDAIIVPGVPFHEPKWDNIMKARVYWSYYLYKIGVAKNIIYSGAAVYSPFKEGEVMALYAEALGIPKKNIFVETIAEHGSENLYYSYKLGVKQGFTKIALASDPLQNKTLQRYSRKFNLQVGYLPINFGILDAMPKIDPVIDTKSAFIKNFIALPDRKSFFYRIKGTFGKNIPQAK